MTNACYRVFDLRTGILSMFKDDPPKEPLRKIAERKWNNEAIRRRIVAEKHRPKPRDVNDPPEIAETVTNKGRVDGSLRRFERRFIKEMRMTLIEHQALNLKLYKAAIEHRRMILLKEKLRRLKLAQQESGGSKC
jgi:hypothetical protein